MRVYVHDAKGKRVVDAEEATLLVEVVGAADGGAQIWAEDSNVPLAADATVEALAGRDVAAVHVGKGQITVSVTYNGTTKSEAFGPGTKIDKVFDWAVGQSEFEIPEGDREDLVLRLAGDTADLDADTHIGTLTDKQGTLALDLVSGERFAG